MPSEVEGHAPGDSADGAETPAGSFWRIANYPVVITLVGFILTGVLGGSITYYVRQFDHRREAAEEENKREIDQKGRSSKEEVAKRDQVSNLLVASLIDRISYIKKLRRDFGRSGASGDVVADWQGYRKVYFDTAAQITHGNIALDSALSNLGPQVNLVFDNYLLGYVEPKLDAADFCLSEARDAYMDGPGASVAHIRAAQSKMQKCFQAQWDWDNLSECIDDIIININDAIHTSDRVEQLNIEAKYDIRAKLVASIVPENYREILEKTCGPMPKEGA